MSLVFFYAPQSSAITVHWTLDELGVACEKVKIDLKSHMKQKNPVLMKVNPNGKVPVLVHDDIPIFESAAIQIYLGEVFGHAKGLYPAPGPRRGEAMKWIVWCNVSVGEALARYLHNTSERIPADQHNTKAAAAAKKDLDGLLKILDEALVGRKYLLGEKISITDFHVSSWMHYLTFHKISLDAFPTLNAWMKLCTARPAYVKVMGET